MRANLITTFHCYDCGNRLEVDYGRETKLSSSHSPDDPTGAAVCYNQVVVRPCRNCIEKYTRPARKLVEAVREIQSTKL